MSPGHPVPVRTSRIADWLGRLRVRRREIDGVVRHDDGECFLLDVALPGFRAEEIRVSVASDHVVIDARADRSHRVDGIAAIREMADVHLILPFSETVDGSRALARLGGGVLRVRAPRALHAQRLPVRS